MLSAVFKASSVVRCVQLVMMDPLLQDVRIV